MSIKIVYCIPSLYIIGGMERTLTTKANYLADKLNYNVSIILTDGKDKKPAYPLSDKIKIINLNLNYDKINSYTLVRKLFAYLPRQWRYKRRLTKVLNTIKPDITISMLRREINFITKINDGSIKIGELHVNRNNFRDFDVSSSDNSLKSFFAKLWMAQLIRNLKKLKQFIVLSYEDKEKWSEVDGVKVIYNPITLPDKISDCSSKKVIAAGRYVSQKGFDMLIDIWKIVSEKHPDWTLTIYGSGNKDAFQKQVNDNNISETCLLMDAVSNLNDKLAESSIFAFSSRFEGFSMLMIEALGCGLPPVSFSCPCGPKDVIENGVNGFLVEIGDITGFAEKICFLIENEEKRREMGKIAQMRSEKFSIDKIATEWDNLFRSLVESKAKSSL